jgi:hypothetical protein
MAESGKYRHLRDISCTNDGVANLSFLSFHAQDVAAFGPSLSRWNQLSIVQPPTKRMRVV